MSWMRRARLVALLLVVLLAGGGVWLTHRDSPSLVLRTIALTGGQPGGVILDTGESRLYFGDNDPNQPLQIIDTRTGDPIMVYGALRDATGTPAVDHQSGHYFDIGPTTGTFLMIDMRSDTLLKSIPIPWLGGAIMDTVDRALDHHVLAFEHTATVVILDGRNGRVLRRVAACDAGAWPRISVATNRLFVPCVDGSILLFDSKTYRRLTTIPWTAIGQCSFCDILADEATKRLFVAGDTTLSVLNARTGTVIRTLPLGAWNGGSLAILPGSHNVVVVPYTTLNNASPERRVVVLDGRTGAIMHRWQVPDNPLQVLVNPLTGHVLVTSAGPVDFIGDPVGNGILSVLDQRTGRIVRQVNTGILPAALAVDKTARHLFIVNFTTALDQSPLLRSYPDGWWPTTERRLKSLAGWLPFTSPKPAPPPSNSTVMMLDLSAL